MRELSHERIAGLIAPYLGDDAIASSSASTGVVAQLLIYLQLLTKWNERMNLTAIRDPEEIVTRHFGESLFVARHLAGTGTLLDLGSGAGFPGLPIQLWWPELRVMLAESQQKKATFLREAVRALRLETEVWADRAEGLVGTRSFDAVCLRAVDEPGPAMRLALRLASGDVWLLTTTAGQQLNVDAEVLSERLMPGKSDSRLVQLRGERSTWNVAG